MNSVTALKTNPDPAPESDREPSTQCIQDNLRMMHAYFDALFTKDHYCPAKAGCANSK
jgi:hypothetical protein